MSFRFDSFQGTDRTFPLRGARAAIVLETGGIFHPRSPRGVARVFTSYRDLTHIECSDRALWIGSVDSVYLLPRGLFADYDAPERLMRAIMDRVAELPDGTQRLREMAEIEQRSRSAGLPRATWGLMALCAAVFIAQLLWGFSVTMAGHYSAALVADGDAWRLVTANLLHAYPGALGFFHIGLNLLALSILGNLVECSLGTSRTLIVMGAAAVASMLLSGWFGNSMVVGVSGVVCGLAGSILWLDYRQSAKLPASWRIPRRSLHLFIAITAMLGVLPFVAMAAHVGGFVAGGLVTAIVCGRTRARHAIGMRVAASTVVALTFLSVSTAGMDVAQGGDMAARYAERYARLPGIFPGELNNLAWEIAISENPSRAELESALMLAERAVNETQRLDATILDTLAEVQFALGLDLLAIETIDDAIAREPDDPYFREQRRRFTGDRSPNDRPEYVPPLRRNPREALPDEPVKVEPGLTV